MAGGDAVGLWFAGGRRMNAVLDANNFPWWVPGLTGPASRVAGTHPWGRWGWFRGAGSVVILVG